jgi:hypothetical protein
MRRLWILPAMLAVLVWALGCGGSNTDQAADTGNKESADQATAVNDAEQVKTVDLAPTKLASVSMSGKLGCAHCTFHIGDSCALAMEAEDGNVYKLEAGEQQQELMDVRYDRPEVKVAGRIADVDGQKVIYTDSVELF